MAPPPIIEAGSGQSDTATASILDAHLSTEATEIPIGRAGFNLGRVKIYFSLPSDQQVDPGPRRFMEALAAGSESSSEWVATASKTIAESLSALARRRDVYDQKFGPFLPNIWNADKLASQVSTLDQAIKSQAGLKTYAVTDATTPVKYQNSSEASATGKKTSQIMIVVPLAKID